MHKLKFIDYKNDSIVGIQALAQRPLLETLSKGNPDMLWAQEAPDRSLAEGELVLRFLGFLVWWRLALMLVRATRNAPPAPLDVIAVVALWDQI